MKHKPLVLLALLLASLLTSCYLGLKVFMINNTGQDITVVSIGPAPALDEAATLIAKGRMAEIGIPSKLRVLHGDETWNYQMRPVPSRFEKRHGAFYRQVLQLEKDGAIYLLRPGAKQPEETFPPQPTEFPLHPR